MHGIRGWEIKQSEYEIKTETSLEDSGQCCWCDSRQLTTLSSTSLVTAKATVSGGTVERLFDDKARIFR